jgi:uncharacterized protein
MPTENPSKQTLQDDLTAAIRSRDELTAATLRMALTALRQAEVAGTTARELSDDEVLAVLRREAKKRRESAEAFDAAGRAEQAGRERAELAVLEAYLPASLDDAALQSLVEEEVIRAASAGATGMAAMGRVVKAVQARAAGRAEGGRIAAAVRARLTA